MSEHYEDSYNRFLEAVWGEGYLSPGGPEEVSGLLSGLDLEGKQVLDIGCGSGGITVSLVTDYQAAHVIGIDVEEPGCLSARVRAQRVGVADRTTIQQVDPGPIPLADESFGIVFSKDSIVHIPDKHSLAEDVHRLLSPGGWFVASDWLIGHDDEPSAEMKRYIQLEDLGFGMASPERYRQALEQSGFVDIEMINRNHWYREQARLEHERLTGDEKEMFADIIGQDELESMIEIWQAMLVVLDTGEHCPHHFRARKPL